MNNFALGIAIGASVSSSYKSVFDSTNKKISTIGITSYVVDSENLDIKRTDKLVYKKETK